MGQRQKGGTKWPTSLTTYRALATPQCAMLIRLARQDRGDPPKKASKQTVGSKALRGPAHPYHGKGITNKASPAQASGKQSGDARMGTTNMHLTPKWVVKSKVVSIAWARCIRRA